jgi:hypothetical protein
MESVTLALANTGLDERNGSRKKKKNAHADLPDAGTTAVPASGAAPVSSVWAFGQDISVVKLDLGPASLPDQDSGGFDEHRALPPSAMERVMQYGDAEQIVVTTRRRRGARQGDPDEDGFFEDDCEVLDFADQRV